MIPTARDGCQDLSCIGLTCGRTALSADVKAWLVGVVRLRRSRVRSRGLPVSHFKRRSASCEPLCVGINHAAMTTSYEADRSYPTDGRTHTLSKRLPKRDAAWRRMRLHGPRNRSSRTG